MKKFIKNNGVLMTLVLFGIAALHTSCDKEDTIEFDNNQVKGVSLTVKTIYKEEIEKNRNLISKLEHISKAKNNRNISEKEVFNEQYGFYIETDIANYIENEAGHSYTFPIYREEISNLTENLLLALQEDGTYKAFIIAYNFSEMQKEQVDNLRRIDGDYSMDITVIEEDISDSIFDKILFEGNCWLNRISYHTNADGTWVYEGTCPWEAIGNYDYCYSYNIDSIITCHQGGGDGDYNTDSGDVNYTGGAPGNNSNYTSPITCRTCPTIDNDCATPSTEFLDQLTAIVGEDNFEIDCDLSSDEMININSIEDLQPFFDILVESNFETTSSEMESPLSSIRRDIHKMEYSSFPQADIVASIKVSVPDDNNDLECLEVLNVRTNLEGNNTLFDWTQFDTENPIDSNGPIVDIDEASDLIRIYIEGEILIGLNIGGYPLRVRRLLTIRIVYDYSTGDLIPNISYWYYTE